MKVIITGATKGIGLAVAEKFASEKYDLIVCARNADDLNKMSSDFQAEYDVKIKTRVVDMSVKEEAQQFGNWIIDQGITPDILINNAGSFLPGSIHNEEDETLEKMIAVNLYSAYNFTRMLLPAMMKAKCGHIFNMCSIASLNAYANGGSYSISKFALLGFSKNLREEMKPYGIKVTAVCPGATMSDSWSGSNIDPNRIMEAKDIAEMIFAASKLSPMAVVEDIILRPQLGDL
jgi:short-subunit dehydrogenase